MGSGVGPAKKEQVSSDPQVRHSGTSQGTGREMLTPSHTWSGAKPHCGPNHRGHQCQHLRTGQDRCLSHRHSRAKPKSLFHKPFSTFQNNRILQPQDPGVPFYADRTVFLPWSFPCDLREIRFRNGGGLGLEKSPGFVGDAVCLSLASHCPVCSPVLPTLLIWGFPSF